MAALRATGGVYSREIDGLTAAEIYAKYVTEGDGIALFYHGPLSNWWRAPYEHGGRAFNCTEQQMMVSKAMLNGDWASVDVIMACDGAWDGTQRDFNKYPREQQRLGRLVKNPATGAFDPKVWDALCVDLVTVANLPKYAQHPLLLEVLALSKGRLLVEASPIDRIWGIGLRRDDPRALDPAQWQGKNYLGQVLTRVRRYLCGF
jgi:ribA/ribD-fused uncharacterized protein